MERSAAIDTGIGVDYYIINIYTGATGSGILTTIMTDTGTIEVS